MGYSKYLFIFESGISGVYQSWHKQHVKTHNHLKPGKMSGKFMCPNQTEIKGENFLQAWLAKLSQIVPGGATVGLKELKELNFLFSPMKVANMRKKTQKCYFTDAWKRE